MIQGFRLHVTSAELLAHFQARTAFHAQRAEDLFQRITEIKEKGESGITDKLLGVLGLSRETIQTQSMNPYGVEMGGPFGITQGVAALTKTIESKARGHKAAEEMFSYYAKHLPAGETFSLKREDLLVLELVRGAYVPGNLVHGIGMPALAFDDLDW